MGVLQRMPCDVRTLCKRSPRAGDFPSHLLRAPRAAQRGTPFCTGVTMKASSSFCKISSGWQEQVQNERPPGSGRRKSGSEVRRRKLLVNTGSPGDGHVVCFTIGRDLLYRVHLR